VNVACADARAWSARAAVKRAKFWIVRDMFFLLVLEPRGAALEHARAGERAPSST
jgi:hypothetical protein